MSRRIIRKIDDTALLALPKGQYVYVLRCSDGTLYTGWTTDPARRLQTHNSGKGAKYTRTRLPVEIVYCECFEKKSDALRREAQIKRLTKNDKEKLIMNGRDNSTEERRFFESFPE